MCIHVDVCVRNVSPAERLWKLCSQTRFLLGNPGLDLSCVKKIGICLSAARGLVVGRTAVYSCSCLQWKASSLKCTPCPASRTKLYTCDLILRATLKSLSHLTSPQQSRKKGLVLWFSAAVRVWFGVCPSKFDMVGSQSPDVPGILKRLGTRLASCQILSGAKALMPTL